MNLVILAVHPARVAATRLRGLQYRDHLAAEGIQLTLWSFFADDDFDDWYGDSHGRRVLAVLRGLRRLPQAVRRVRKADVVLVQREALPFGPPLLERWAARRRPLIWDVDDAVWRPHRGPATGWVPQWLRATGGKFEQLCRTAAEVWAGSPFLAEWCSQFSLCVVVVPTVVFVEDERPALAPEGRIAGWIGTHSTGPFLDAVLPALREVQPGIAVEVVGARVAPPEGLAVSQHAWSPAAEAGTLGRIRVGLYPVDDAHPLADGKCALKAILYMAHGIPPVVTPTRPNALVVRDDVDGLHAATPQEWVRAVERLMNDDELWKRCSEAAHARARAEFSLQTWGPRVAARVGALGPSSRKAG